MPPEVRAIEISRARLMGPAHRGWVLRQNPHAFDKPVPAEPVPGFLREPKRIRIADPLRRADTLDIAEGISERQVTRYKPGRGPS